MCVSNNIMCVSNNIMCVSNNLQLLAGENILILSDLFRSYPRFWPINGNCFSWILDI